MNNEFEHDIGVEYENQSKYDLTIENSSFFQRIQTWPLNDELNYKGWLDNFPNPEEKEIACYILDFFMFYPKPMINQMLKTVIGYCGEFFNSRISGWSHDDFLEKCIYSFIPGETNNPTDSGHMFVRKLKQVLHIPEKNILYNNALYYHLEKVANTAIPVIFVDDFVGSGAQCVKAWNENRGGLNNRTFNEIASNSGRIFIYAPLIANHIGYEKIEKSCNNLKLITCHKLNHEYNLFAPNCICWKNNSELYKKGVDLIISKSIEQGISFTGGLAVNDAKGFCEQGLALAFVDNGVPDAIPALFYWCSDTWTPLVKRGHNRL